MNELIKLNKYGLNLGSLEENVVGCDNGYIKNVTKIIHVRSRSKKDGIGIKRLLNIENLNVLNLLPYLDYKEKVYMLIWKIFTTKLIKKVKHGNKRDFYFLGKKIFSYDKSKSLKGYDRLYAKRFEPNLSLDDKKEILSALFNKSMGKKLNLDEPKTFNEKLQWLKLFYQRPIITKCADKVEARNYFLEKIENGEPYLVKQLGIYSQNEKIDFDSLPEQFVLKSNWGSGTQIIVQDKASLNIKQAVNKINKWFEPECNHYYSSLEYGYKNIVPKLVIEELLDFEYKIEFFCFNGIPKFLWVVFDDKTNKTSADFYDLDWKIKPLHHKYPNTGLQIDKPECLEELIEKSKVLANDFPFVRVDFYKTKDGFKFSELTFFHWAGLVPLSPEVFDLEFGELIKLPEEKIFE